MCLAGKKIKITLAKSRLMCYYHWAENEIYPGVAKFGIALEWGSRGRWFESSHSDQKGPTAFAVGHFCLWNVEPAASVRSTFNRGRHAASRRSRIGRWFESSHSDQISRCPLWDGGIFLFDELDSKGRRVRKHPGGVFSRRPGPPAGGRIQSLGPRKNL